VLASIRSIAALLAGAGILILGNALLGITLPIRMGVAEMSTAVIGLVMACYFAGLVVGCLYAQVLIGRIGHIRAFAAFAAGAAAATLIHALWFAAGPWAILRLVSGFCMAGLFATIESWLNMRSTNETRGRVLACYMVVAFLAAAVGQFLVNAWDVSGVELFCLAALLLTLSLVPVVLTRVPAPEMGQAQPLSFRELYGVSPLGVVGAFGGGLVGGAFYGMGAVFGHEVGLSVFEVSLLMGLTVIGGLILQWPIGRLSDRFDRRTVLLAMLAAETAICLLQFGQWILLGAVAPLLVLTVLFGGIHATIYPISVAHAFDHVDQPRAIAASSGLLLAWAFGATAGPLLASLAMDLFGPSALFLVIAIVATALGAFTRFRMRQRAAVPAEEQKAFVPLAVAAAPATQLDPRIETPAVEIVEDAPGPEQSPPA
jgi:MFS family permease